MNTKQTYMNFLRDGVCEVTFTKENGEERFMNCTTRYSLIPWPEDHHDTKIISMDEARRYVKIRDNPNLIQVYDLDKKAWRSFRVDRVKKFIATVKVWDEDGEE